MGSFMGVCAFCGLECTLAQLYMGSAMDVVCVFFLEYHHVRLTSYIFVQFTSNFDSNNNNWLQRRIDYY